MRIYLDHAATTPPFPEVEEAMRPWLRERFGNASSLYFEGREARAAIDGARDCLSKALGCEFGEVIFTSGGTEAANLAILGVALGNLDSRRMRILIGAAEHHCVLNTRPILERLGYRVELVPALRDARPDLEHLAETLGEDVLLVSLMSANNELGTITDTKRVAELAHECGTLYFCDAAQLFPRRDLVPHADLIALAAHKLNGPKGAGALFVKAGTRLKPHIVGGGQERELRAGTEDVAAIVGFAAAVARQQSYGTSLADEKRSARDAFVTGLQGVTGVEFTVPVDEHILSGHAHLRLKGVPAESALIRLDRVGVSASSGAACSSGSIEPSHVLLACGYSPVEAAEGLRFTFGLGNTVEQAKEAAACLASMAP